MEEPKMFTSEQYFTLGFEIVYITKEFTHYQMAWHYGWIVVVLVFMFVPKIGFFYEMMQLHQNFWSRQQVCRATATFSYFRSTTLASVPLDGKIEGDPLLFYALTDAGEICSHMPRDATWSEAALSRGTVPLQKNIAQFCSSSSNRVSYTTTLENFGRADIVT